MCLFPEISNILAWEREGGEGGQRGVGSGFVGKGVFLIEFSKLSKAWKVNPKKICRIWFALA